LDVGLAPLAIAWVLRDPIVSVALSGTRRTQEIVDNVRALDVSLSPTVLARIDECLARAGGQTDALPVPDWS
jgi:aryl-alcohol dehydrogenase-like predicted oxidoreductase